MTSVVVNKTGSDVVDIEFIQPGSAVAIATLKDGLLDGSREYVMGIVDLVVDLESTPMFPITEEFALFTIHRRNVGVSQTANVDAYTLAYDTWVYFTEVLGKPLGQENAATDAQIQALEQLLGLNIQGGYNRDGFIAAIALFYSRAVGVAQAPTTVNYLGREGTYYASPDKRLYSPGQFVQDISEWVRVFNIEQTINGIHVLDQNGVNLYGGVNTHVLADIAGGQTVAEQIVALREGDNEPLDLLTVGLSLDGTLMLEGTQMFWNNFTISVTNYCRALMGFDNSAFTNVGGVNYIQFTGDTPATSFVNPAANDTILAGGNTIDHIIQSAVPIYQTCDQRVKISMHSDLSYPSAIKIENEVESRDRDICSAFFTNTITSEVEFNPQQEINGGSIISKVYNGRYAFIKKTDPHHQWSRLINSFDVRLLRFYLQVTYRDFSEADDTFTLSKKDMVIPEKSYYQFVARFISTV